jgi:hypothetical protein
MEHTGVKVSVCHKSKAGEQGRKTTELSLCYRLSLCLSSRRIFGSMQFPTEKFRLFSLGRPSVTRSYALACARTGNSKKTLRLSNLLAASHDFNRFTKASKVTFMRFIMYIWYALSWGTRVEPRRDIP